MLPNTTFGELTAKRRFLKVPLTPARDFRQCFVVFHALGLISFHELLVSE